MATVNIPTSLRPLTGGQARVQANGRDISALIEDLEAQFPGLRARLVDDAGQIKRFVSIYVNNDDVRTLAGKATPVAADDAITIIPPMAGG